MRARVSQSDVGRLRHPRRVLEHRGAEQVGPAPRSRPRPTKPPSSAPSRPGARSRAPPPAATRSVPPSPQSSEASDSPWLRASYAISSKSPLECLGDAVPARPAVHRPVGQHDRGALAPSVPVDAHSVEVDVTLIPGHRKSLAGRRSRCGKTAPVSIEVRSVSEDEFPAYARAIATAFGGLPDEQLVADWRSTMALDRTIAAFDGREVVGTAGAYSFELTLPGGTAERAAGVTVVGVRADAPPPRPAPAHDAAPARRRDPPR